MKLARRALDEAVVNNQAVIAHEEPDPANDPDPLEEAPTSDSMLF